jgi:hypothetical protein
MRLKARLDRLAQQVVKKKGYDYAAELERQRQDEDWLRGEGPEPPPEPCPFWRDTAAWASRQRISRATGLWLRGEYRPGERLPGMTGDEVEYVAQACQAMLEFAEIYPIFLSSWVSSVPAVPDGDIQLYGAALTVALSDRLAVGLNQGGYADAHFSRNQRGRIVNDPRLLGVRPDRRDRLLDIANGGNRDGFLNLGGFAQYTSSRTSPTSSC